MVYQSLKNYYETCFDLNSIKQSNYRYIEFIYLCSYTMSHFCFCQMDRIAAPTLSSSMHMAKTRQEVGECPKCCEEANNAIKVPQSRRWWSETTRHLTNLRTSLVKQKILPAPCKKHGNVTKTFVTTLVHSTKKIDEIVAKSSKTSNIPIYPKLRLTRPKHTESKIPVPVTVHLLQFPKLKPHHICTNP